MSELMNVQVEAETETWVVSRADPDDPWSRDSTGGRVTNVTARMTSEKVFTWCGSSSLVKALAGVTAGDVVYAVVADYESGDTFGRSGGRAQVMDVFSSSEDAEGLVAVCRTYGESRGQAKISQGVVFQGRDYYVSWDGYFERLNSVDVWAVTVRREDNNKSGIRYRIGR